MEILFGWQEMGDEGIGGLQDADLQQIKVLKAAPNYDRLGR
jgi:hypothetical protein